jgi:hypothetical protein
MKPDDLPEFSVKSPDFNWKHYRSNSTHSPNWMVVIKVKLPEPLG